MRVVPAEAETESLGPVERNLARPGSTISDGRWGSTHGGHHVRSRQGRGARRRTGVDDAPTVGIGILASVGVILLLVLAGAFVTTLALGGR
jgi:hypothetical protein